MMSDPCTLSHHYGLMAFRMMADLSGLHHPDPHSLNASGVIGVCCLMSNVLDNGARVKSILIRIGRITWNVLTRSDAAKEYPDSIYRWIWEHQTGIVRSSRFHKPLGKFIYKQSRIRQKRERCEYTRFLRLRPQLEVARHVVLQMPQDATLRIAILGCSTGAELYSFLWLIRSARPDLKLVPVGVDISSSALDAARIGRYSCEAPELENLSQEEVDSLFIRDGDSLQMRDWIAEGVTWIKADVCDPKLCEILGYQDIVVANNFLIHMFPPEDETALRNIVRLLVPGGYLFVHGVDLDVRTRVARNLGFNAVPFKIEDQHNTMDPDKLPKWPWHWCGREPLDKSLPDWELRYSTVFHTHC
jgi:SAM-dependent methyltransferase